MWADDRRDVERVDGADVDGQDDGHGDGREDVRGAAEVEDGSPTLRG